MKEKEIIKNVKKSKRVVSDPDYRDVGAILLFIFLLPYIVSFFFGNVGMSETVFKEGEAEESVGEESTYIVCNTTAAGTEKMPLETYLVNRLPATIDMGYEMEALKAQAIVLRTELLRNYYEKSENAKMTESGSEEEKIEDEEEGKRYIYVESDLPQVSEQVYEKSKEVVGSTKGMFLMYEGVPIAAPYFALSAGRTRGGDEAFHSEDYPYLKSVVCERDFTAENYMQIVKVSKQAFYERLWELANEDIVSEEAVSEEREKERMQEVFSGGLAESVHMDRDQAGYVTDVSFGDAYISGEGVREAFSLNSSCFEWEEENNTVIICVKGVGHGIGFCHYGANEAAKKGSDYIDILKYFFTDIVIEKSR